MNAVLAHPDALVTLHETDGKHRISVCAGGDSTAEIIAWVTCYPPELIEHVLRVKGPTYLCDEIRRDEDPCYVEHDFQWNILSYVGEEGFAGRRLLDFGSGCGASSMVLARLFPRLEIRGVELVPDFVNLSQERARYYGVGKRVRFELSPDSNSLPPELGDFDFIMLSAVYEHLLPRERPMLLPLLWKHLKPDGIMFLNQTPYRWSPVEEHTTGLPLINYFPDRLALICARRFSRRVSHDASWDEMLRQGIRGGAAREIMGILNRQGRQAELLTPSRRGTRSRVDIWYHISSPLRRPVAKKVTMWVLRAIEMATGVAITPSLSLAIRKLR